MGDRNETISVNNFHSKYVTYVLFGGSLFIQYIRSLKQRGKKKKNKQKRRYQNFFELISYTQAKKHLRS